MILSYLNEIKEKYITEQETIKKEIDTLDIQLKENTEFIKVLEESMDSTYEFFTPRSVNPKNKQKIDELLVEQKEVEERIQELNDRYSELENKVNEVEKIIKEERKEEEQQKINENKLNSLTTEKLHNLLYKTELCYRLIDIDPTRCKLELSAVLKMINEIMDDMQ